MLMEQLAGGRAISLPAGAVTGIKASAAATGPYSMIRRQFGFPIGMMEGVQSRVAELSAMAYMFEGARVYSCSAIDAGEQPPVISAVLKYASTEHARKALIDGMDVFSGAGVMQGPNNILGTGYSGSPVGITVEGANIMTRTLIIFGQGATRCHPYALPLTNAVENDDADGFRRNLLGWFGHTATNWLRTKVRGLTRGFSAGSPVKGPTATYYRRLAWSASRFALLTDLAMYLIGGKLKIKGNLTGRYADALTWQVLALSALRRYEAEGRREEDLPVVQYACEFALARIQEAFEGIHENFDAPLVGWWLRHPASWFLRVNPLSRGVPDRLTAPTAGAIQSLSDQYRRLTAGLAPVDEEAPGMGRVLKAFRLESEAAPAVGKILKAQSSRKLPKGSVYDVIDQALEAKVITETEAQQLRQAGDAVDRAIEVDVFTPEEYFGTNAQPSHGDAAKRAAGASI